MQEGRLVGGRKYKVRLKPKEELIEVVAEHYFQEPWFKDYMDGQVGVLHYDSERVTGCEHKVLWEGAFWYYRLECLKILGEVG